MEYLVVLHHSKHGYDVRCPALQGCHSQGETRAEALANIRDAIRTYLEMLKIETRGENTAKVVVHA